MRALLLAAALAAVALPACAQAVCGDRTEIAARLAGEVPVGRGLSTDGRMVEIFASAEGTWTLVVTRPDGRACLAGAGEAWEAVAPEPAGRYS